MLQILVAISQSFVAKKRHGAMQKLFIKKELRRNGQVSELSKQWVLRCPAEKKEKRKRDE